MGKSVRLPRLVSLVLTIGLLAAACAPQTPAGGGGGAAQKPAELKVAMVDFQSGGAAKFGAAALNAGKLTFDQINAAVPNFAAPPDIKSTIAIFSSDGLPPPAPGAPGTQALASRPSISTALSIMGSRGPLRMLASDFT